MSHDHGTCVRVALRGLRCVIAEGCGSSARTRRLRAGVTCALACAALAGLGAPSVVFADDATITVTTTSGQSDPAAGLPRIFTLSGNSAAPEEVFVKYRAPGGAPCAPNAASDTGQPIEEYPNVWWGYGVNGDFSFPTVFTWPNPGTTMFCIWIAGNAEAITTPITQMITFRAPGGTINATVSPPSPLPGQEATITLTGVSEAPEEVFASVKPAGATSCAPTFEADSGQSVIDGDNVNGSYSVQNTYTQDSAGTYELCAWLASSASATPAIAGPQPVTFVVGTPLPPPPPPQTHPQPPRPTPSCVVPRFDSRMSLATVKRRIAGSHCRVGRIRYARSRSVRRGDVVRLTPEPHTRLGDGAFVGVLVSTGRH